MDLEIAIQDYFKLIGYKTGHKIRRLILLAMRFQCGRVLHEKERNEKCQIKNYGIRHKNNAKDIHLPYYRGNVLV
jgi:hypothetical protein